MMARASRRTAGPLLLCLWLACGGCTGEVWHASGSLAGVPIAAAVDSELAAHALAAHALSATATGTGTAAPARAELDARIEALRARYDGRPLDAETLAALAAETSTDFAAIEFVRRVLLDPAHAALQRRFRQTAARLRAQPGGGGPPVGAALRQTRWLFVPGWLYRDDPGTGADFATQRAYLAALGFDVALVPVDENGTVEANARAIAEAVRAEAARGRRVVLVSTSKGGPEAALALGSVLAPEEARAVAAWISIGGIHRGSRLADNARRWPLRWLVGALLFLKGFDTDAIESMTTQASQARLRRLRFPPGLRIYLYVAVPLSGTVTDRARDGYEDLRAYGPNDGLTLLGDELLPGAGVVIAPGLDHFFQDPDINLHTLAFAHILSEDLAAR